MIQDYFFFRHWAETVRLYSGLLDEESRIKLIKEIATQDILLAAECRATSFSEDEELDEFLTKEALLCAKELESSHVSAKGMLALAELNKFDDITKVFLSTKTNNQSKNNLYYEVVSNYIAFGSELQITMLLSVLADSNIKLLNRTLDKIFEQDIIFSQQSVDQAVKLIEKFKSSNEFLLQGKIVCIYRLHRKDISIGPLLESFLHNKLIKYVEKFIALYKIRITPNLIHNTLDEYIQEGVDKTIILSFLNLCSKLKTKLDYTQLRIKLSHHPNPMVKRLSYLWDESKGVSRELIVALCDENIKIGSKASINFVLEASDKFGLSDKIDIEYIIENLLKTPKPQRLELAYRFVKQHDLSEKFSYQLIFYLLVNTFDYQSLTLAKKIIIEEFPFSSRENFLLYLGTLLSSKGIHNKLLREIVLKDLSLSLEKEVEEGNEYYGIVSNFYKNYYSLQFANDKLISISREFIGWLKIGSFVRFKITKKAPKIKESQIAILKKEVFDIRSSPLFFQDYFVGQYLELNLKSYNDNFLVLSSVDEKCKDKFVIERKESELTDNELSKIPMDLAIKVLILRFDKYRKNIYCSFALMKHQKFAVMLSDENIMSNFKSKVEKLQKKYSGD